MSELKVLHEHSIVMDTNKKREFFVTLYCGSLTFNIKEGSGTTTVFELSPTQFLEISKKLIKYKIEIEKQRIEGVLLGLSIAKKAWDKDLGRNEIYENEILYKEELAKLS